MRVLSEQILRNAIEKVATITFDFFGIKMPAIYALPVQKLKNSEEYFQEIVNA